MVHGLRRQCLRLLLELGFIGAGAASPVDSLNPFDSLENEVCALSNDVGGFQAFFLLR
jgi:hypothetical protein